MLHETMFELIEQTRRFCCSVICQVVYELRDMSRHVRERTGGGWPQLTVSQTIVANNDGSDGGVFHIITTTVEHALKQMTTD